MSTCANFLSASALTNIPIQCSAVHGFTCSYLPLNTCFPTLGWKYLLVSDMEIFLLSNSSVVRLLCGYLQALCAVFCWFKLELLSEMDFNLFHSDLKIRSRVLAKLFGTIHKIHFKAFGIQGLTKIVVVQCLSRARRALPGDLKKLIDILLGDPTSLSVPTSWLI